MVTFDWWIFLKLCRSRGSHNNLRKNVCLLFDVGGIYIFIYLEIFSHETKPSCSFVVVVFLHILNAYVVV